MPEPTINNPVDNRQTAPGDTSISPAGDRYPLPTNDDHVKEVERLKRRVAKNKLLGREIVVVMGVGFVGAVLAAVVADAEDKQSGTAPYFVIGMQRPSVRSYWKIPYLRSGLCPVEVENVAVAPMVQRCVWEKKTLTATFSYDVLTMADIVIVEGPCDYPKKASGNVSKGQADIAALENSFQIISERIRPECLVLVETSAPPGTTEYIVNPIINQAFNNRGLNWSRPTRHSAVRGRALSKTKATWNRCASAKTLQNPSTV